MYHESVLEYEIKSDIKPETKHSQFYQNKVKKYFQRFCRYERTETL